MADIVFTGGISIGTGISITPPPFTVPNAPTIGTATTTGSTTATVSFTQPGNNGGLPITSYTATSSPGGITGTLSQAGSGTINMTGLSQGTSYTFTVTATNSIGTSSPSSASNSITTYTVPGAPTIGTATAIGSTTATVTFTQPASNGGSTITSYTATSSPGGITGTLSQAGSGTITVNGLTPSTSYTFTVTATNSVGTGSASSASNSTTTTAPQDTYFEYNTLLIPGASTTFVDDASTNNFAVTINGDTKPNNFNPYTPGYYSVLMASGGSSGSYFSCPATTPFSFGTGDFCVETWVYATRTQNSNLWYPIFDTRPQTSTNGAYPIIGFQENTGYLFAGPSSGPTYSTTAVTLNTWLQVVWTRVSNVTRCFVNGVLVLYNGSDSTNYLVGGNGIRMGSESFNASPNSTFPGYFSNYRVSKGGIPTAYSTVSTTVGATIFTPPTIPATTSGTLSAGSYSLLTFQSNRYIDNSSNASTITPVLSPSISSSVPFTPNNSYSTYGSGYFDGTGDRLVVPANAAFNFSTGDFTVECWVYLNSVSANQWIIGPDNTVTYPWALQTTGTAIRFISNNAANDFRPTSFTLAVGTWNHFAVTRSGSTMSWFTNGTLNGTQTYSTAIGSNTIDVQIGTTGSGSGDPLNGYVSNLRVVKGTAVYTSSFTPSTTPLTAITNTSLLTCQSNRFIDNSSNAFTLTKYNDVSVQRFSPFNPTTAYSTSVIGGSMYLDGTTDFVKTPSDASFSSTLLASNFTIECWIYLAAYPSSGAAIWTNSVTNSDGFSSSYVQPSGVIGTGKVGVNEFNTTTTIKLNTWTHIAIVRNSSTVYVYFNGVQDANTGAASTYLNTSATKPMQIGSSNQSPPTAMQGYISDFRVVASALYTTGFTPNTAPLTAISGTNLLLSTTNAAILDNAEMNDLETVGNAQISTSVKKYGTGSLAFDGSGDWLQAVSTPQADFGSGNFTLECWAYLNNFSTDYRLMAKVVNISSYGSWQVLVDTSGYPRFYASSAASSWDVANGTGGGIAISTSTWAHIAVTRSGSTITMWVNGVSAGTSTSSASLYYSASVPVTVGGMPDGTRSLNGNLDEVRITKGVARYTSTFTPSTTAFPNN